MKVETKWWIEEITKKRNEAPNKWMKAQYNKQLNNLEAGRCPYGCIDWKKQMEDDRDRFIGVQKHERLVVGSKKLDKKYK